MDSVPSCGSSFTMDASRVTVTNVDPSSGRRTTNCGLTFSYTGQDVNRLMCLDFTTLSGRNPGCEFNYTLNVNVGSVVVDVSRCVSVQVDDGWVDGWMKAGMCVCVCVCVCVRARACECTLSSVNIDVFYKGAYLD